MDIEHQIEFKYNTKNIEKYLDYFFCPDLVNMIISYMSWKWHLSENKKLNINMYYVILDNKIIECHTRNICTPVQFNGDKLNLSKDWHIKKIYCDSPYIYVLYNHISVVNYYNKTIHTLQMRTQTVGSHNDVSDTITYAVKFIKNKIIYTTNLDYKNTNKIILTCSDRKEYSLMNINLYIDHSTQIIYTHNKTSTFAKRFTHDIFVNNKNEIIVTTMMNNNLNVQLLKLYSGTEILCVTCFRHAKILYCDDYEIIVVYLYSSYDKTILEYYNRITKQTCEIAIDSKYEAGMCTDGTLIFRNLQNRVDIYKIKS